MFETTNQISIDMRNPWVKLDAMFTTHYWEWLFYMFVPPKKMVMTGGMVYDIVLPTLVEFHQQ